MSEIWQTEESNELRLKDGNYSGYEGLLALSAKRMEELEDMVNQKLNCVISHLEQRFEEMNQRIHAIGQTVVKLEVAVEKLLASTRSNLEKKLHNTQKRCMKLLFSSNVSLPILTGEPIKGEGGNYLQLSLIDNCTGTVVDFGREASAKVEIVALVGDSDDDEGDAWTTEEFQSKIARDKEGKRSVLAGNLQLKLNRGTVSLYDIKFRSSGRHNSGIFKLGAWVDTFDGSQVIEGKTKSFQVNDYRRKYIQKHHPPSASDEVWRLENIAKGGPIHDRLNRENVNSVKDFQTLLSRDPDALKCLLGLPAKKWEATMRHAQTWIPDNLVGKVPAPADACSVLVASAYEDEGVAFDAEDSLLQCISSRPTAVELLSSPGVEHSRDQDIEDFELGEPDPTILNCSSDLNCTSDVEFKNWSHSSSQGLGSSSSQGLGSSSDSDIDLFELIKLNNLLNEVHGVGSSINYKSPKPAVMFMNSQAASVANDHKKNWTILFTVSKWFSRRKRIAAVEGNINYQKKPRICY